MGANKCGVCTAFWSVLGLPILRTPGNSCTRGNKTFYWVILIFLWLFIVWWLSDCHLFFWMSLDSLVLYLQFIHDGYLLDWFSVNDIDEDTKKWLCKVCSWRWWFGVTCKFRTGAHHYAIPLLTEVMFCFWIFFSCIWAI